MSEERIEELGLRRRGFLKKTAAVAFVAPAIVSFGLDGTAEATPTIIVANGCYANQAYEAEQYLIETIGCLFGLESQGSISIQSLYSLSQGLLQAAYDIAGHQPQSACSLLAGLIAEMESLRVPSNIIDPVVWAREYACGGVCVAG